MMNRVEAMALSELAEAARRALIQLELANRGDQETAVQLRNAIAMADITLGPAKRLYRCPECQRKFTLNADGTLRKHHAPKPLFPQQRMLCAGSYYPVLQPTPAPAQAAKDVW